MEIQPLRPKQQRRSFWSTPRPLLRGPARLLARVKTSMGELCLGKHGTTKLLVQHDLLQDLLEFSLVLPRFDSPRTLDRVPWGLGSSYWNGVGVPWKGGAPSHDPMVLLEVSLPTVNVYNVEFAELPNECYGGGLASPAPLPASIPMDIMSNIAAELQTSVFLPHETLCSLALVYIYIYIYICIYR